MFETLIEELNRHGVLLSELYQRREAEWFVALRRPGDFSSAHGTGKTPYEALSRAAAQVKPAMTAKDWDKVKVRRVQVERYRLKRKD